MYGMDAISSTLHCNLIIWQKILIGDEWRHQKLDIWYSFGRVVVGVCAKDRRWVEL